jgi:hypothetical protein
VRLPSEESIRRGTSAAMNKTNADCLRLLRDRRLGSFHRLRDLHHGCPCFRMGFELPQILLSPRIANGGLLLRMASTPLSDGLMFCECNSETLEQARSVGRGPRREDLRQMRCAISKNCQPPSAMQAGQRMKGSMAAGIRTFLVLERRRPALTKQGEPPRGRRR